MLEEKGKNPHKFQRTFAILNISKFLLTALLNDYGSEINIVILRPQNIACIHCSGDNNDCMEW